MQHLQRAPDFMPIVRLTLTLHIDACKYKNHMDRVSISDSA